MFIDENVTTSLRSALLSVLFISVGMLSARSETQIERGRYLVHGIVACGNCHTPKDSDSKAIADRELAGGPVFNAPIFHAISPNITPDIETGIGNWTDDQIVNDARWPAKDSGGHSPAHSRHEHREPALGSAADPRRTAQAWHRCRADHRGEIHGQGKATTVAGLEDVSAQSCRRHRLDGLVCSPDDIVSTVVWISDLAAFPPQACVAGCDRAPELPLDCAPTDRGLRHATDATIYR